MATMRYQRRVRETKNLTMAPSNSPQGRSITYVSTKMSANVRRHPMPHYATWKQPLKLSPIGIARCDDGNDDVVAVPTKHPPSKEESCVSCLYTGIVTCTALSGYFFKMAFLDFPEPGSREFTRQTATNKRFFIICGTAWAGLGIYRWHLG